jgi:hypothetical protein
MVHRFGQWLPAVFAPFWVWWLFHTPTTGKAGLALALAASLMPLIWERSASIARSIWIATVCILFFVEYNAISKDHEDNEIRQAAILKEERDSFRKILEQGCSAPR